MTTHSFRAGEDLSDHSYYLVRIDEQGSVVRANGGAAIGTLLSPVHEGGVASVSSLDEIFLAVANSPINIGDYVRLAGNSGGRVLGDEKIEKDKRYLGQALSKAAGKGSTVTVVPCRLT